MMTKLKFKNILTSRYFYLITLLSAWLMVLVFGFNGEKATDSSLQLSSTATSLYMPENSTALVFGRAPESTDVGGSTQAQAQYYELQIKLQSDRQIYLQNMQEIAKFDVNPTLLKRGSTVSITVPRAAFGPNVTDPTKIRGRDIDLTSVLNNLNTIDRGSSTDLKNPMYEGKNEVTIQGTGKTNRQLVNESGLMDLRSSVKRLKVTRVTEVDEGSDEPTEFDYDAFKKEAGVNIECKDCSTDPTAPTTKKNFLTELPKKIMAHLNPVEQMVARYEGSKDVQELMSAADTGYTAVRRDRRGRVRDKTFPRDGVPTVSLIRKKEGSIGACYNGVKSLLVSGGMINSASDLPGIPAKLAGPALKRNGFVNLMETEYVNKIKSPKDAPIGAVLVYESVGPKYKRDTGYPYGHIEVRTDQGFMSDFFTPNGRTGDALIGRGRKLIGVYIKSDVEMPGAVLSKKSTNVFSTAAINKGTNYETTN